VEDGSGGGARRTGAGEEDADPGRRASGHADEHEQPRLDVPGPGQDGGCGDATSAGAGEEKINPCCLV